MNVKIRAHPTHAILVMHMIPRDLHYCFLLHFLSFRFLLFLRLFSWIFFPSGSIGSIIICDGVHIAILSECLVANGQVVSSLLVCMCEDVLQKHVWKYVWKGGIINIERARACVLVYAWKAADTSLCLEMNAGRCCYAHKKVSCNDAHSPLDRCRLVSGTFLHTHARAQTHIHTIH